jgi:general secretion pathway protein B
MSYILDALRKADAQRAGVPVAGLEGRPPRLVFAPEPAARWPLWVGLAAAVIAVALAAWWWLGRVAPAAATVEAVPAVAPEGPQAAPPVVAPAAVTAPTPVAAPAPLAAPAPAIAATQAAPAPRPAAPELPQPAPQLASVPVAPAPSTSTASAISRPAPAAVPAPLVVGELPADLRKELPPLAVSGSIYSDNPAQRLLIVNGQLLHEGDAVTTDLTLQEIGPKAAIFRLRGQRFLWPY